MPGFARLCLGLPGTASYGTWDLTYTPSRAHVSIPPGLWQSTNSLKLLLLLLLLLLRLLLLLLLLLVLLPLLLQPAPQYALLFQVAATLLEWEPPLLNESQKLD